MATEKIEATRTMSNPEPDERGETKVIDSDSMRLADMGYEQAMQRKFSNLSLLGLSFTLTSSWFGFSVSLVTGLASAGTVLSIYGIPWMGFVSACVGVSLSELASSMPTSGGQYFWTTQLAPKRYANILAFMTGWSAWAGAIFTTASSALGLGQALVGMWQLAHPDFVPQPWHGVLAYVLVNGFCFFFNCVGKLLPKIGTVSMYVSLVSFLVIFITVPASTHAHASGMTVFASFTNSTGWSSDGLAFLVGMINPNWLFVCLDSATHLAEEVSHPERVIPRAILGTVFIGFLSSWIYCIAMFFSISDLEPLLDTPTGIPILQLFYDSTSSKAAAIVLESLVLATGIGCQIASQTYQSRLCWSFARDAGLPGHKFLSKIHHTLDVPLNAHFVSCFMVSLLSLLYLGSSTAFNSLVTASIVLLYVSYAIPIICLLVYGRSNLTKGPFWLGRWGLACNWITLLWTVFTLVIYSFPAVYPVTAGNMNYVVAVYAGMLILIAADWMFRGRTSFIGASRSQDPI